MAEMTVTDLAKLVKMPEETVLAKIEEAGLPARQSSDAITNDEKMVLVKHLQGGASAKPATLRRRSQVDVETSSSRGSSSGPIVELKRKKPLKSLNPNLWLSKTHRL